MRRGWDYRRERTTRDVEVKLERGHGRSDGRWGRVKASVFSSLRLLSRRHCAGPRGVRTSETWWAGGRTRDSTTGLPGGRVGVGMVLTCWTLGPTLQSSVPSTSGRNRGHTVASDDTRTLNRSGRGRGSGTRSAPVSWCPPRPSSPAALRGDRVLQGRDGSPGNPRVFKGPWEGLRLPQPRRDLYRAPSVYPCQ